MGTNEFQIGNLVIVPKLKNRWGIPPAGEIIEINEGLAKILVFNLGGPGANTIVTGVPLQELERSPEIS